MIATPTVLVLGAGASNPYGLPTAVQLRKMIVSLVKPDKKHILDRIAYHVREPRSQIKMFIEAFTHSHFKSVDAFLAKSQEFLGIGRVVIAYLIAMKESRHRLSRLDWMAELFALMDDGCRIEDFANNKLAVVTFNYDRVLELALHNHLRYGFGAAKSEVKKIVKHIPIVHAYGRLGSLYSDAEGYLPFDPPRDEPNGITFSQVGERLHFVEEELKDDSAFVQAQSFIANADRVIFLGFSFHPLNVRRITEKGRKVNSRWLASGYGLTEAEKRIAQGRVPKGQVPNGMILLEKTPKAHSYRSVWFGHTDHDAARFLREHADFLLEE